MGGASGQQNMKLPDGRKTTGATSDVNANDVNLTLQSSPPMATAAWVGNRWQPRQNATMTRLDRAS